MISKRHNCKLTERLIRQIEYVLPKLKYSVYLQQIRSWLENFEEKDVENALDFLFYLEYIPFSELQTRLDEQLKNLYETFDKNRSFLLIPFADYPKSSDIIMYLIKKSPTYEKIEKENRVEITRDLQNHKIKKDVIFVYVDDFIGTGKSFGKWYKKNKVNELFNENPKPFEVQTILAAIIMENGAAYLKYQFPEIEVFAEMRTKVFSKDHSPFNLSGNRSLMRALCLKYGLDIRTNFRPPYNKLFEPFGYGNSEALVAFDYGTPNNSLSIIWGESKWNPIYPRSAKSRMRKAREIKSEAAYYIGLMNKLNINFEEDLEVKIEGEILKLTVRDDYAILVYLILKDRKYTPLQICQILGVTLKELDKIVLKGTKTLLVNRQGEITRRGIKFTGFLKSVDNVFNFRKNDKLEVRDNNIFVPKSFGKLT